MDVEFDMQMTNAGIAKFYRAYTPGAHAMKRILQQFDSGRCRSCSWAPKLQFR